MASRQQAYDWNRLRHIQFESAKRWWSLSITGKIAAIGLGLAFVWFGFTSVYAVIIVAIVSIASDVSQLRSDSIKSDAESILRKLEFRDSFGWELTPADARDLLARVPEPTFEAISPSSSDGKEGTASYFSSTATMGPKRAAENFLESAWWSKHLATDMFHLCLGLTIAVVGSIVLTMILVLASCSAFGTQEHGPAEQMARIATSSVLLVFSTGLVRFSIAYWKFGTRADVLARKFEDLAKEETPAQIEVLKAIEDYHLARASTPLFPTWLQNARRARLNRLWAQFRS